MAGHRPLRQGQCFVIPMQIRKSRFEHLTNLWAPLGFVATGFTPKICLQTYHENLGMYLLVAMWYVGQRIKL
jgi:hypothetical protein